MSRTQSSLFASLLLVFVSGVAVGGVGHYLYTAKSVNATSRPDSFRQQFVEDMRKRVGMNDTQIQRMNSVLDETRQQYKQVRDRMTPDFNRIKSEQREKINELMKVLVKL